MFSGIADTAGTVADVAWVSYNLSFAELDCLQIYVP
jgi:hypothetical protein